MRDPYLVHVKVLKCRNTETVLCITRTKCNVVVLYSTWYQLITLNLLILPINSVSCLRLCLVLCCAWCCPSQIVEMKYKGLTVNYANIGLDMRIDMGLQVFVS